METDPALTKNHEDIFVIQKSSTTASSQVHRKDLERFLGLPVPSFSLSKHCGAPDNKKDLSSFLGVNRRELARVLRSGKLDSEGSEGSGGSLDTDSSSLWSTLDTQ